MRLLILLLAFPLFFAQPASAADAHKELRWEELVPKGWDPSKEFRDLDLGSMQDSDPRAMEALAKLQTLFDNAPTEPAMAGRKIRLPGFAIPLEHKGDTVREFLLVPYFGACIHTPPPPANQILHVVAAKPAKLRTMDPVWVNGTLSVQRADTPWGKAGYRLTLDRLEPYKDTGRKAK
jgi:hypothetical protein